MLAQPLTGRLLASSSLFALAMAGNAPGVLANPEGGNVVAGQASIVDHGNGRLEVRQASNKAVIDWRSFSIGQQEHTHFSQPGRDAVALNRVTGKGSSTIAGRLSADGRIILLNPNGILFTDTARVDVAGLIASTSRLDTQDFMADRYRFAPSGNPDATVVNQGTITVRDGGLAALVSPWVENSGVIAARFGKVALASGEAFTADFWGDGLITLEVTDEPHIQGVSHTGAIQAEGGVVALSVAEASGLVDRAVNMDGVIEATRVAQVGGRIILEGGDGGSVQVAGRLDASGTEPADQGGEVTIAGRRIELAGTASIDVSGPAGGGEARLGGAFRGGPPIPEAKPAREVMVAKGAVIDADATRQGDGGTVVAWADDTTRFSGTATARGGPDGGDGGLIETSGKQSLDVTGAIVDALATDGDAGTWLLDPRDFIIAALPDPESDNVIDVTTVVTTLQGGTNFRLVTSDFTGEDAGDITIDAPIDAFGDSSARLSLTADRDININAPIMLGADSGAMSIDLTAGGLISQTGLPQEFQIVVDGDANLRAQRIVGPPNLGVVQALGDITRLTSEPVDANLDLTVTQYHSDGDMTLGFAGGVTLGREGVLVGGDLTVDADGTVVLNQGALAGAGDATVRSGIDLIVDGPIAEGLGNVALSAARQLEVNADIDAGDGDLLFVAGAAILNGGESLATVSGQGDWLVSAGAVLREDGTLANGAPTASVDLAGIGSEGPRTQLISSDGTIRALSPGDIALDSVNTPGRVEILADFDGPEGGLADGQGRIVVASIQGTEQVTLTATTGMGSETDPISVDSQRLLATNTDDGDVFLSFGSTGVPVASLAHQGAGRLDLVVPDTDAVAVDGLDAPGADVALTNTSGELDLIAAENGKAGSLTVTAETIVLGDVTTTGDQSYTADSIRLNSTYTTNGGDLMADGAVELGGALTEIDTRGSEDGLIRFLGTIDGTSPGGNSLTFRSGDGQIEVDGGIGGQVPLNVLTVDTSFAPTAPAVADVSGATGSPIGLEVGFAENAIVPTAKGELLISGLPPGSVLSDGVNRFEAAPGTDTANVFDWNLAALTLTPPPEPADSVVGLSAQVRGLDANQVSLPDPALEQTFEVSRFEPDASGRADFAVTVGKPSRAIPPHVDAGSSNRFVEPGLDFAIPNARPARLPDITPVVPSASQIQAQIAQSQNQIEPAGPDESEKSKAARERVAELEAELAATYDPWEACPEVGAVSTAWQNTPADAAFNYDPAMLPYSVDVFCGGYQLTGPARGAVQDYSGLSFVTRDFWTDRRQAVSPELLQELRDVFGLVEP